MTMIYSGHVRNGQIALDEPARLPEGAAVSISVLEQSESASATGGNRRQLLAVSVEERRNLLAEQSRTLEAHYNNADADRSDWQCGDIVE